MSRAEQVCLIVGERVLARELLDVFGATLGTRPRSISDVGLNPNPVRNINELAERLEGCSILYDLEALCWQPWLRSDPLRFLRTVARRRGVIALWPGSLHQNTVYFSALGRRDYASCSATGVCVLRPRVTRFPDEVPYTLERIA
jgi:hypothetical protein